MFCYQEANNENANRYFGIASIFDREDAMEKYKESLFRLKLDGAESDEDVRHLLHMGSMLQEKGQI